MTTVAVHSSFNHKPTFSMMTTLLVSEVPAAIRAIPLHCGHHVMDNGDGTVCLAVWSEVAT